MKNRFNDINDPELKFELIESGDVDGEHILAKVRGVFFCPNGRSRNGRYYSKDLWESVLQKDEVNERLKNRNMFGTVGHETTLDDKAVLEGLVSHIVTKLEIDENDKGMGEALILNTPAGQTLNTILRAGGQMYVSTRANGTLKGKHEGIPMVDKETYEFQTVDFVCRPGFLEANPSVAENLDKLIEDTTKNGEVMSEQLIKLITDENAELKSQVSSLTSEVKELAEAQTVALDENKHLTGEMEKLEEANKIINSYGELGTVEEIKESISNLVKASDTLAKFDTLGESFDSIKTALEIGKKHMSYCNENFGSIATIEKALKLAIDFRNEVNEIGTIGQIKESIEKLDTIAEERLQNEKDAKCKELAEELSLPVEKVSSLLEKYSEEDIKELHGEVSESSNVRYKKQHKIEEKEYVMDEELYESKILSKSYAERI